MAKRYYAKTANQFGRKIEVHRHLKTVSKLAGKYAAKFDMKSEGETAGLLHDFGKYSERYQNVLKGKEIGIDHAFPGARLFRRYLPTYVEEAIAAHHDGLKASELLETYQDVPLPKMLPSGKASSLQTAEEYEAAAALFFKNFHKSDVNDLLQRAREHDVPFTHGFKEDLLHMMKARMILSCLVDADYSVSAYEQDRDRLHLADGEVLKAKESLATLEAKRAAIGNQKGQESLQKLRDMVWADCGKAAAKKIPYMTLTAPTSAGKTMGYLRYALAKCARDKTRKRIILVLPYLSLVDQVAELAKEIIPGTIVDTSTSNHADEARVLADRWSAPCIVTTTVQFFGSLFSGQPGDVRKLHRLTDAVIVFDEISSLPDRLAKPALESLYLLVRHFHADILLASATLPPYGKVKEMDYDPVEVIKKPDKCFSLVKREGIRYMADPLPLENIADMAIEQKNTCVIVNLRRHARAIYARWKEREVEGIFLLSSDLCAAHRAKVVTDIKERQSKGLPVHVVSTQCMEAGMDMDFEMLYRAMAPLPSLILSAGRQNREHMRQEGEIYVFVPKMEEGEWSIYPDGDYAKRASVTRAMAMRGCDLSSREVLDEYYAMRFFTDRTESKLSRAIFAHQYQTIGTLGQLIQGRHPKVLVPYDEDIWNAAKEALSTKTFPKKLQKRLFGSIVQGYTEEAVQEWCDELCFIDPITEETIPTGIWLLKDEYRPLYDQDTGLVLPKTK